MNTLRTIIIACVVALGFYVVDSSREKEALTIQVVSVEQPELKSTQERFHYDKRLLPKESDSIMSVKQEFEKVREKVEKNTKYINQQVRIKQKELNQ